MPRTPFTIDTDLKATKSPLTATFIDTYLKSKQRGELSGIGKAVIAASEKYHINAAYIVGHAALETGWGTSNIAMRKNNLFGWSAFDATPYESAKAFPTVEACIDFVMGRIDALYLTAGGTYFKKAPCLGRKGSGGYGMNVHYASDEGWGQKIARIAESLEGAYERTAPPAAILAVNGGHAAALPSVETLLARARGAVGHKIRYTPGEGGMNPKTALPGVPARGCDSSGFVCWCLGLSRQTSHPLYVKFNGGWINTTSLVHDALEATGYFKKVSIPMPGCLIVYPSKGASRPFGLAGVVTEVSNSTVTKVIHCSRGNHDSLLDAIAETGPEPFDNADTIYMWYEGIA